MAIAIPPAVLESEVVQNNTPVISLVENTEEEDKEEESSISSNDPAIVVADLTPATKEESTEVLENLALKSVADDNTSNEELDGMEKLGKVAAKKEKKKKSRRSPFFRGMRFGVGLYGGVSSSATSIDAKDDRDSDYVILRAQSEKQLETLHFGFNAIAKTESNIYLRAGAEYTRVASLFSRNAESVVIDSFPGVVEYQINELTGDTVEIEGFILRTTTTNFTKKSYNYFHLIDIPVVLGINFGDIENDWVIGIEGGIYANVSMRSVGEISLIDGTFYDIEEDKNEWYKTNVGISPFIGINAGYNISENIQIHVSPSFRFNSVFSTDKSVLKEQHANLGIRGGVRYFFD